MSETTSQNVTTANRAILGISAIFFLNGTMIGSLSTHFAALKTRLDSDASTFSLVVMAMAVGAICAMSGAGMVLGRFGSAAVVRACALLTPIIFVVPTLLDNPVLVALALFVLGASNGLLDTSMNVHASACEKAAGRLTMVRIHAAWSVGGILGALSTGSLLSMTTPSVHALLQGAVLIVASLASCSVLLPAETDRGMGGQGLSWPSRSLAPIAAMAFLLLFCAASMRDWSAVYLRETFAANYTQASQGFAAFSAMTAVGRLFGDRVRYRLGDRNLLMFGGLLGAAALAFGLGLQTQVAMIASIGLLGLAHSILTPLLFSAAGKHPVGQPATNISAVMTVGFLGYVVGPPLIGMISQATNLGVGLASAIVASSLIAVISLRIN